MPPKHVAPDTIDAFSCPHCGALSHQHWFNTYAVPYKKGQFPYRIKADLEEFFTETDKTKEQVSDSTKELLRKTFEGGIFTVGPTSEAYGSRLYNLDVSKCFSCGRFTVWQYSRIVYPQLVSDIVPNTDMPEDVRVDFIEAAQISGISPRGSAALLRLAIQKLCKHLGEKGKNINEDIASMVAKGLDVRIQKSLDIVRIVGNESVHPGQIDIRDDPATVNSLFSLVNIIVDTLITQPKNIDVLYDSLPDRKKAEIDKRDAKS